MKNYDSSNRSRSIGKEEGSIRRSSAAIKTLAQAVVCITPLWLPLATAEEATDDAPPLPTLKFTPPPPPKQVPPMRLMASSVMKSPTHQITLIRGEASTLPDLPPPPITRPSVPQPEGKPSFIVSIGATVYDHRLSQVTWTNPETKESFEAWCGWDFTLLSPLSQIAINGKSHSFFLAASHLDTAGKSHRLDDEVEMPPHPAVAADAFVITAGDPKNAAAEKVLTSLRDYFLRHRSRLVLIQKAQEEYQAAATAWHAAHPPKPENHTFWLKPHRGSCYLKHEGGGR
jgi:hypothetical protein